LTSVIFARGLSSKRGFFIYAPRKVVIEEEKSYFMQMTMLVEMNEKRKIIEYCIRRIEK